MVATARRVVAGYLLPTYELFSVEAMLRFHEIERDVDLEEEVNAMAFRNLYPAAAEGDIPGRYFPSECVPIGGDGAGNCLVMDCGPVPSTEFCAITTTRTAASFRRLLHEPGRPPDQGGDRPAHRSADGGRELGSHIPGHPGREDGWLYWR